MPYEDCTGKGGDKLAVQASFGWQVPDGRRLRRFHGQKCLGWVEGGKVSKRSRQRSMIPLYKMVEDSIAFIREHEPPEGYFVGFSGGKDSICTLELTRMAGVKHEAYYSCTGIDPPEVVKFIKQHYPDVKWLYPKMSFWEGIRKKNPPLRVTRWCCDVLKKNPSSKNQRGQSDTRIAYGEKQKMVVPSVP